MKLPKGMGEAEVLATIEMVVSTLSRSYAFGYYGVDDIMQEARILAIEGLNGYHASRGPLANFLSVHIRNRLKNLIRDKYRRADPPCQRCHCGDLCNEGQMCRKYQNWYKRNSAKANIMQPADISNISDEHETNTRRQSTIFEDAEIKELCRLIDDELPLELRQNFLLMREGASLPKAKRAEVEAAVRHILKEKECGPNQDD